MFKVLNDIKTSLKNHPWGWKEHLPYLLMLTLSLVALILVFCPRFYDNRLYIDSFVGSDFDSHISFPYHWIFFEQKSTFYTFIRS